MFHISCSYESDEIMVRTPSGQIRFLTTWDTIKLMFNLVLTNKPFTINGELIERWRGK